MPINFMGSNPYDHIKTKQNSGAGSLSKIGKLIL